MRGKHRFWLAALAAIATPAMAQESAPPGLFMNQAGIEQTIALLASRIKPDQPIVAQPLIGLGSYRATLEYRQAPSGAAIHEAEAEYFQVVDGSGTLITMARCKTRIAPARPNWPQRASSGAAHARSPRAIC
jgi:hypothetical protein